METQALIGTEVLSLLVLLSGSEPRHTEEKAMGDGAL